MKNLTLVILTSLFSLTIYGQDITGQWNGALKIQGTQMRLVFNISQTENSLSSTMDSPDQGAKGIPTTTTSFENSILKITIANAKIEYEGTLANNKITGTFKQYGQSFPMDLSREKIEAKEVVRPQEPKEPFSYYSENVTFENKKAGISLAGTLTLPKKVGVFPVVVILITGSGPQNRNEELLGHKPFLVISDYLTKNGIAILRYDDRGIGESKGNFAQSTTEDFATDVEAAVNYLLTRKEINKKKIGLIGHSEGGLIAPMVASKSKDVSFIVLLAGTGISGDKLLLLQQELIGRAGGATEAMLQKNKETNAKAFEMVVKSTDNEKLKSDLKNYLTDIIKNSPEKPEEMKEEDYINLQINQLTSPWMEYFIKYNPALTLEKVKCPVLAINGSKDLQVPPKENLEAIKKALAKAGNKKVTIKELLNLNHLFQECETGSPEEYESIEQTFSPIALTEILNWLKTQTK
jgi:fermentation-respiration switch protein FrsA (DUF1100 family)